MISYPSWMKALWFFVRSQVLNDGYDRFLASEHIAQWLNGPIFSNLRTSANNEHILAAFSTTPWTAQTTKTNGGQDALANIELSSL